MALWLVLAAAAALAQAAEENIATTEIIISHGPPPRGPAIDEVIPGLLTCRDALPSEFSASIAVLGRLEAEDGKGRLNSLKVERAGRSEVEAALVRCVLKSLTLAKLPMPAESGIALRYLLHFRLAPPPAAKTQAGTGEAPPKAPKARKLRAAPSPEPQPPPKPGLFPKPIRPRAVSKPKPKPKPKAPPKPPEPSQSEEDAKAREAIRQTAVNSLKLVVDACFRRGSPAGSGADRYLILRFDVVLQENGAAGFESITPGAASTAEKSVAECAVRETAGLTFRVPPDLLRLFPPEGMETSYPFTSPYAAAGN